MTTLDPASLAHVKSVASRILAPEYDGFGEIAHRFPNGDVVYWRPLFEGDDGAKHFDVALIVRTTERPRNAMASMLLTREFLEDDASNAVIGLSIDHLRKRCEEHIAAA